MMTIISKTGSAFWAVAIPAAAAAVVLLGLVWPGLSRPPATLRPDGAATPPSAELAIPALLTTVTAPVIDRSAARFVGTGDGSNGSWSQP
jgi:hypothetical protein